MNLYDILACPLCKLKLARLADELVCTGCEGRYPIINGVPVLLPDHSVPSTAHVNALRTEDSYSPWFHRVVLQSLLPSSVSLDLGAGNTALNLPNVIRMDVVLTPYVDVVGDAHALPFLPGSFDFIFSQAVIEHLRQPFLAAEEMYMTLKSGGYVYGECNFTFPYHGYPHHYFNASLQGLEQVFGSFDSLRSGVGPHQMPSFAVRAVLEVYRNELGWGRSPELDRFQALLDNVLAQPLGNYDALFSQTQAAQSIPAGVFYLGRKPTDPSEVIPGPILTAWQEEPALQARFPTPLDLTKYPNLLSWAKTEGTERFASLFEALEPFRKDPTDHDADQRLADFEALPIIEPTFTNVADSQREPTLVQQLEELRTTLETKNQHIQQLENLLNRVQAGRVMRFLNLTKRVIRR